MDCAQDDLIIYYFDGSQGCDICNLLTGYTFDKEFRPHPHCDCPIESLDMETIGDCTFELRGAVYVETYDQIENSYTQENRPCLEEDLELTNLYDPEDYATNNLSSELEDAAEAAGWISPEDEEIVDSITIPANTGVYTVKETVGIYHADIEATWHLVCKVEDHVSAMALDKEYGDYTTIYDIHREVDAEPCE
jgi:hypothetical protein